jgi:alpha-beta hydrolase superfamily lysophospholipase
MKIRPGGLIRKVFKALAYSAVGAFMVLVIGLIVYMNGRADLHIWHLADLDEEFTVDSKVETFDEYLALEDRLFKQLDELVYAKIAPEQRYAINRYNRGSLTDPEGLSPNWNRSFVLPKDDPKAAVLLLHGMSDSPYSLRNLGQRLNAADAYVLGLRVPGHGTAPSGLVEVTWQDMAAAVRLAVRHLAQHSNGKPLYVVGYSNGGALAVHYALSMLQDETLPKVERVVLMSPEIGVPASKFAIWQARIGHLLGLEKLAWNDILPEYEAFKYGSFAVNAGDVVYRITSEIQKRLTALDKEDKLKAVPPILAFTSVIDATVSTPALVSNLFDRLPAGGHELVLFDVNRIQELQPLMKWDPAKVVQALQADPDKTYILSVVTNENVNSRKVIVRSKRPGEKQLKDSSTGISWPQDIYSLAHVALPFPADDPLYGGHPPEKSAGLHLGELALRGERGALQISASSMLRLRWNPFYPYMEERVIKFLDLDSTSPVR